jgi:lysophospholipase L1-like esterase
LTSFLRQFCLGLFLWLTLALPGLADSAKPRVLVMGDSLMASNRLKGGAVSDALEKALGTRVKDHSVIGARYFYILPISGAAGMRIDAQFRGGPWDYVVLNGGGNDLLFGCGCGACKRMLDRLISPDGRKGAIPDLVTEIRKTGARVIYTGYLRTPGVTSPVEACGPLGDRMDARLAKMAAQIDGVSFVPLSDLVTKDGDTSFHSVDLIHPSVKGSHAIAARVAARMGQGAKPAKKPKG